jgi:hypothetical protein
MALYSTFAGRNVIWSELSWSTDVWVPDDKGVAQRLYQAGDYNPYNDVNILECAAHLTHPANTLGAEIDLAAKATVQRLDKKQMLVKERRRLACCSNFGDCNRNSDPTIGLGVNQVATGGTSVTLADPVGLYMLSFDDSQIADQKGSALPGWWQLTRGIIGYGLRAEFKPPEGAKESLADVRVGDNAPLTSGGQLAELVTMVIYAKAAPLGVKDPPAQPCSCH